MATLDWEPSAGSFCAESRALLDRIGHPREYRIYHTIGFAKMWHARLDGTKLARGPLQDCLDACDESEAEAAGPIPCSVSACHCDGREAAYMVTLADGHEDPASQKCADMHVMAGISCRPIAPADILARAADDVEPATAAEVSGRPLWRASRNEPGDIPIVEVAVLHEVAVSLGKSVATVLSPAELRDIGLDVDDDDPSFFVRRIYEEEGQWWVALVRQATAELIAKSAEPNMLSQSVEPPTIPDD